VGLRDQIQRTSASEKPHRTGRYRNERDGNGKSYEVEFMGTGFLAEKGLVLTTATSLRELARTTCRPADQGSGYLPKHERMPRRLSANTADLHAAALEISRIGCRALFLEIGTTEFAGASVDEQGESIARGSPSY